MNKPKVSVLIPMYNRKHYIEQCIDSALNQTFDDYEIIIRDNCSTDGGFEFVQEKYAQQISDGKIRLYLNEKDVKLAGNTNLLIDDAVGKYIAFLHSDDMYLPNTIQHLYEVAEATNADVVHSSFFFNSSKTGIINSSNDLTIVSGEKAHFNEVTILPDDPFSRFNEWITGGIFIDAQYNLFNRNFVLENNIFTDGHDYRYCALLWIMLAKVLVKTPVVVYIRRDAPDSGTNSKFQIDAFESAISDIIQMMNNVDKHLSKMDFFKENEQMRYMAKAHLIYTIDQFFINQTWKSFVNGITPEIFETTSKIFKKYFGENYIYPLIMYNWAHVIPYNKQADIINFDNCQQN